LWASSDTPQEHSLTPEHASPRKSKMATADAVRRDTGTAPIRVGFVSSFLFAHSVGRLVKGLIKGFDPLKITSVVVSVDTWGGTLSNENGMHTQDTAYTMTNDGEYMWTDPVTHAIAKTAGIYLALPFPHKMDDLQENKFNQLHCRSSGRLCHDDLISTLSSQSFLGLRTSNTRNKTKPLAARQLLSFMNNISSLLVMLNLDVIIYPELGMDNHIMQLASQRLAPIQMVFWGHPIPQALPQIDYFISSQLYEPCSASVPLKRRSVNEQTVLLPGLTVAFTKPKAPLASKPLLEGQIGFDFLGKLGLHVEPGMSSTKTGYHLYLLPHTIMKYSVAFDRVLLDILAKDPSAVLLLLYSEKQLFWMEKLFKRLSLSMGASSSSSNSNINRGASSVLQGFPETNSHTQPRTYAHPDLLSRIVMAPKQKQEDFYRLLQQSAVVLDTFPFGMGVTALEALSMGVPIVTLPRKQTVLSLAAGMLRALESKGNISAAELNCSDCNSGLVCQSLTDINSNPSSTGSTDFDAVPVPPHAESVTDALIAHDETDYVRKAIQAAHNIHIKVTNKTDGKVTYPTLRQRIHKLSPRIFGDSKGVAREWELFLLQVTGTNSTRNT